jgi:predicted permease
MFVRGQTYVKGEAHDIYRLIVSPNFFDVMEMPLVAGRPLTAHDAGTSQRVAIINEAAARKYFYGENPIGRRFGTTAESSGQIEVIGLVHDAKYNSLRDPAPPTMYVPYTQSAVTRPAFEVRTIGSPPGVAGVVDGIREVVRQLDPTLPLTNVSTQADEIDGRFRQERLFAQAYSLFGGAAMLIASIGLFGLMSYSVARRTNEIGIRMALGAARANVLRLVMSESMTLVVAGLLIGLAMAFAVRPLIASLLFGLAATDVMTLVVAISAMLLVTTVASYLPAWRASRVDPLVALRYD